jgi:hypothetical protein
MFPTQTHDAMFWEQLGRTIATYGFLERVLGQAIFAFVATQTCSVSELETLKKQWNEDLPRALYETLGKLADIYSEKVSKHEASGVPDVDVLVQKIKAAAKMRNLLCHASWAPPDAGGKSLPFFVNRRIEVNETKIDVTYLRQVQDEVACLAYDVIDSVTQMGYQFPGGGGPGEPVW